MSSTTKKKHVCREVLDEYVLPTGSQEIVRVQAGRGNNLHEVTDAEGKSYLVSMPTKFRKNVWIKRGDFVIKLFQGAGIDPFLADVRKSFGTVKVKKPKASRAGSREVYLVARNYRL